MKGEITLSFIKAKLLQRNGLPFIDEGSRQNRQKKNLWLHLTNLMVRKGNPNEHYRWNP